MSLWAALFSAQLISGGLVDCAMAVGFEKMQMGSLTFNNADREGPIDHFMKAMGKLRAEEPGKVPGAPWLFGAAGAFPYHRLWPWFPNAASVWACVCRPLPQ